METVKSVAVWIYVGVFLALFGFSVWAGSSGVFLPDSSRSPRKLKKDTPRKSGYRTHRRHRYFWPSSGVRGGK